MPSNKKIFFFGGLLAIAYTVLTLTINRRNPGFISIMPLAIALSLAMSAFVVLLVKKRFIVALILLILISILSVSRVNPLDRNLDEITETDFAHQIRSIHATDPTGRWATNDISLENYALANSAPSLSGTYSYPQLSIWESIDKNGASKLIYNRYSHVIFRFDDLQIKPVFRQLSTDSFQVTLSACDPFLDKYNVKYLYGRIPVDSICAEPLKTYRYGLNTIYIYQRK